MVHLIAGNNGKGKTVYMLDQANAAIKEASGNIIYLDVNSKHMYELNNKIRLIDVARYAPENVDQFIGFILGILSQDHDIEEMYLDNFFRIAKLNYETDDIEKYVLILDQISNKFNFKMTLALTMDISSMSEKLKEMVSVAL